MNWMLYVVVILV